MRQPQAAALYSGLSRFGSVLVLGVEMVQVGSVLVRSKCLDEQICSARNPWIAWIGTNSSSKQGNSVKLKE